jgi:hypothetical protein
VAQLTAGVEMRDAEVAALRAEVEALMQAGEDAEEAVASLQQGDSSERCNTNGN